MSWFQNYRLQKYYKKVLNKSRGYAAFLQELDAWLLQESDIQEDTICISDSESVQEMLSAPLQEPFSDDIYDVYAESSAEAEYERVSESEFEDFDEPCSMPLPAASSKVNYYIEVSRSKSRSLEDLVKQQEETFQQMLLRLIREKGYTNAQVYKKANQDRRQFSKILHNTAYQPSKKTALAYVIALELNMDEAKDLLARAGFAFSPSSTFDKIIAFFIENEVYEMYAIEAALYEHGQETLCVY